MIRPAKLTDLAQINALLDRNGLVGNFLPEHLKEECWVGEIDGDIRGMIWASVSKSHFLAFVDYFAVDYDYKGLGVRLAQAGLKSLRDLGVKRVVSIIEDAPQFQEAMRINRFFGLKTDDRLFRFFMGEI